MFSTGRKIKILYCGITGRHSSDIYRLKGFFQNNLDVYALDYRKIFSFGGEILLLDSILHAVYSFQPDLIFVNKGEKISPNIIKTIKKYFPEILWFLFYGDMREKLTLFMKRNLSNYDALLINADDKEYWDMYKEAGIKMIFYYHSATDTDIFKKILNIKEKYDIGFFGGNYHGNFPDSILRYKIVEALIVKYKVLIHGNAWGGYGNKAVYGDEYSKAASSCKILLGISNFNHIYKYTSNRTWNSMATGFVLHYYFNGIEILFKNNYHLVWFKKPNEMFKLIDYFLEHPVERKRIYRNGRELMKKDHTYKMRAKELSKIFLEVKHVKSA